MTIATNASATAPEPQAAGQTHRPRAAATLLPRRPYPGLRPFEKAEWPIFRGRDRLIQDILTILAENHFVSVIGPSGSGKSSLVRAGVLATLERRHSRMGVRWVTGTMRPGVSPLWFMADGILRALRPDIVGADGELPVAEVARLRVLIDASEDGLATVAREVGLGEDTNFLLLVDQFEEIFRYRSDEEDHERTRLIEVLLAVAKNKPSGIYIITTMRSEYLGDCSRFKGLAETLNETHYLLPGMTEDELCQAIIEPAELKNGHIEDVLVERLVEDIRGQEDQLPILQHTLLWMWIQEEERLARDGLDGGVTIRLGLPAYEALEAGGPGEKAENVKNALSCHGDRILAGMPPEERRVAEIMFRRLVEVEEHSNRLRRPARCGTVARLAQVPLEVVQRVVDAFRADDASFIYASKRRLTDDTSIDIMHESLIRQWDALDCWVRREKASYEVFNDLCRAALRMRDRAGTLLAGLALSRAQHWLDEEQPTRLWARRYGGDFDAAMRFLTDSEDAEAAARRQEEERLRLQTELEQRALRARLEEQTKLAHERRRFTQLATAAAVVCSTLAAVATGGFIYAQNQAVRADKAANEATALVARVSEATATSLLYRLKSVRDPIETDIITALWDLTAQDEKIRVEVVRQVMTKHELRQQFGLKPQPIFRAVGLKWPNAAREIVKKRIAHIASDQFELRTANPSDLVTYVRALASLHQWLDPTVVADAKRKLARGINDLARQEELDDKQLRTIVEAVAVFGKRLHDPAAIAPAQDRLRREIGVSAALTDPSNRRARAIGRAIEIMSPILTREERLQAVHYLVPLLGQNINSWPAQAIPRAMTELLPKLDPSQVSEAVRAVPAAIAIAAVAKSDQGSAYLLGLIRVVETLARTGNPVATEAFSQALVAQFALPNKPVQRAALALAALPLLENRNANSAPAFLSAVAAVTLLPDETPGSLSPARKVALADAEGALRQALAARDDAQKEGQSGAALRLLRTDLSTTPHPSTQSNLYRRAAQARLLEMLSQSLTEKEGTTAAADLRALLALAKDYLTRDAIARAFAALSPKLPPSERKDALTAAKQALATTGSSEEATAWAHAITVLLPAEPRAATAEIVEALKYPTATEAPSVILLEALSNVWPEDYKTIAGKTLPDQSVLDWLQAHLPADYRLTDPPPRPQLEPTDAGFGR